MDRLRMGVIGGTGGFGGGRARAIHADERADLIAISGRTQDKADEKAAELGAKAYADWRALIDDPDIDAVAVATPNAVHFEMAKVSLEAGKHTLVEYPICQTLEQFDELVVLAEEKGVVLHHGLTVRYERLHSKIKELVPRLGTLIHGHYRYFGGGTWYVDAALRGDAFMALHIHFIDQFEDIFGETQQLNATLKVIEDGDVNIHSGSVLQEFAGGADAVQEFGMGYGAMPGYQGWHLGTEGWLQFENTKEVRLVLKDGTDEMVKTEPINATAVDTVNFIAQVLDGADSCVPEGQTRRTMRLCLAAAESASSGCKIDVS